MEQQENIEMNLIDLDTEVIADAQENEGKEKSVEGNGYLDTVNNAKQAGAELCQAQYS